MKNDIALYMDQRVCQRLVSVHISEFRLPTVFPAVLTYLCKYSERYWLSIKPETGRLWDFYFMKPSLTSEWKVYSRTGQNSRYITYTSPVSALCLDVPTKQRHFIPGFQVDRGLSLVGVRRAIEDSGINLKFNRTCHEKLFRADELMGVL